MFEFLTCSIYHEFMPNKYLEKYIFQIFLS